MSASGFQVVHYKGIDGEILVDLVELALEYEQIVCEDETIDILFSRSTVKNCLVFVV